MEFLQVDVFADAAFEGNPLAVFPSAEGLTRRQMQAIAREMNLSETSFVTAVYGDSYDARIFTPREEMAFAGHPTIGTAWVLHDLGLIGSQEIVQRSPVGATRIELGDEIVWYERPARAEKDLEVGNPPVVRDLCNALGLEAGVVGLEARELGRPGRLAPAFSDAGLRQLMVPLRDVQALAACRPRPDLLAELTTMGAYCFTAVQAGRIRARGFFASVGVDEDPATGSAAGALGAYLADRLGPMRFEVLQGAEVGRPSRILVEAAATRVRVGGRCHLALVGRLERRP
jgi:trans-2,3-dihydro-3-hydroxyanthranilate isomerase